MNLGAALDMSAQFARLVSRFGAIEEKCRDASGKAGDRRRRAEMRRHASVTVTGLSAGFNWKRKLKFEFGATVLLG